MVDITSKQVSDAKLNISEGPKDPGSSPRFFMGALTETGFRYFPSDLYDSKNGWRAYLIKSGSGTGKSTLIKRLITLVQSYEMEYIRLYCSSDVNSLDGVLIPEIRLCLLDSTMPHFIEPVYWGATERIVFLGECLDEEGLYSQLNEIVEVISQKSKLYEKCRKFISTSAALIGDNRKIVSYYTDREKIQKTALKAASDEFGKASEKGDNAGSEIKRFLSAVTPQGLITFHDTLQQMCSKIYSFEDEFGVASSLFMEEVKNHALEKGYDIISCPCPLDPDKKIDHVIIPELSLGFTTSNKWQKVDFPVFKRIHSARFTDGEKMKSKKHLISFNKKAASQLLEEAVLIAQEAKAKHEVLESIYIPSMDWNRVEEISLKLLSEIEDFIKAKTSS